MSAISRNIFFSKQEDEIDIIALLHDLWKKKWLILFTTFFFVCLGMFYAARQLPQFQTDILLQIDSNKQSNNAFGGLSKKLNLANYRENSAAAHSALIQSRFILEPVIKLLSLDIKVLPAQSFLIHLLALSKNKILIESFTVGLNDISKPFTLVVGKHNNIKLYNDHKQVALTGKIGEHLTNTDHTISLKVTAVKANEGAKFIVIKLPEIDIVKQLLKQIKIKDLGTKEETGILQISLHGTDPQKLTRILDAIAVEVQRKDIEKKSLEASQALKFLRQQLPLAKKSLTVAETNLNLYRKKSGKIDIKFQTQSLLSQISELDKQLDELHIKKTDMEQQFTLKHPYLAAIVAQIQLLTVKHQQLEKKLKKLPASDQIAVNLMRDVKIKNSLYLILLSKIQELEFIKAGTISNVRILSFAKIPDKPLPTNHTIIYGGSLMLGLVISFLLLFIKKILATQINDPYWMEQNFNVVNLCIIPFCKEQTKNMKKFNHKLLNHIPVLANVSPRNLAVESLRSLRTSLQVSLSCAPNNIISILGIAPNVGKSFVSANLAWLLAVAEKKVLLIDGDLRRGIVHKSFKVSPKPGLVDAINNTVTIDQALQPTEHPNLTVLTRGSNINNSSELIMSNVFNKLLHSLSQQFDVVIIDTTPILQVTDGVLLAALSGINYLVIGAGIHDSKDILMVMQRLENAKVQVHGSIFNYSRAEASDYKYTKYDSYYNEETITDLVKFTRNIT